MTNFEGILPAIVTPFDDQLRLNGAAFERLLAQSSSLDDFYARARALAKSPDPERQLALR